MVADPSAHPAAAMVVVAQTIPADADDDCAGLIEEDSMAVRGMMVGGLIGLETRLYPKSNGPFCQFLASGP